MQFFTHRPAVLGRADFLCLHSAEIIYQAIFAHQYLSTFANTAPYVLHLILLDEHSHSMLREPRDKRGTLLDGEHFGRFRFSF